MLASEYSWTMDYILDCVYPDDLIVLADRITKRRLDEAIMNFRITSNPHLEEKEAKKLAEELFSKRRELWGLEVSYEPLDKEAFDSLRDEIKKESKSITAK